MGECNTLVLVDDEQAILEALVRCLRWADGGAGRRVEAVSPVTEGALVLPGGGRLLVARSGEEALAQVRQELAAGCEIAGGFIDLKLGQGMDGLETIRELRALAPRLLCTVLTGYDDRSVDEINELFLPDHGADWDYMAKPFTRWEVVQRSRQMVETWKRRRREEEQLAEIHRLNARLRRHAESLEERVEQRTHELADANQQLERRRGELEAALQELATAQGQLLQVEKMGSIGQLSAGVSRAVAGPLGLTSASLAALEGHFERLGAFVRAAEEATRAGHEGDAPPPDTDDALLRGRMSLARARRELRIDYALLDAQELIAQSREGLRRIRGVVDSLGAFARPASGELVQVDVNRGLRDAVALAQGRLADGAEIDLDLGELPRVMAMPSELNELWMSLLSNAADAVREQGAAARIQVLSGIRDGGVSIEVRDNGPGLSEDAAARIFEPFYTTKPAGEGSGLGLSVAHGIVRRLGGELCVESSPGEGARFRVELPVASLDWSDEPERPSDSETRLAPCGVGRASGEDDEPGPA